MTDGAPNSAAGVRPPGEKDSEEQAGLTAPQPPSPGPAESVGSSASSAVEPSGPAGHRRFGSLSARIGTLVRAIQENDEAKIEEAILRLSESRRVFAPLAFAVGALVMLFN